MFDGVGPAYRLQLILTITSYFLPYVSSSKGIIEVPKGVPCIYEGHLQTKKNWYGFIANISIVNTGRMNFEFVTPSTVCCHSILFYSEDQMSIINSRMNCWQKEYVLRPEEDQLLRLTPRFVWSGCQAVSHGGVERYICEGGRSLAVEHMNGRQSWYIAVSNCETMHGLNLHYRIRVYGQVGECKPEKFLSHSQSLISEAFPVPKPSMLGASGSPTTDATCVVKGELNTTETWYGFITNTSVGSGGGLKFEFSYPHKMQVQNIILYNDVNVKEIQINHDCWQKEGLIRNKFSRDQIIDLSLHSSWNGCLLKNISSTELNFLVCKGHRTYNEPREIFIAVSNCKSTEGIFLNYHIEVFGFTGEICSCSNFCGISFFLCFVTFVVNSVKYKYLCPSRPT